MWVSLNLEMIGVVQFVDCNASLSLWSTLNNLKPPRFIFASLNFCCSTQMFLHFCFWTSDFLLNFQSTCFSFFTLSNGAWIFFFFFQCWVFRCPCKHFRALWNPFFYVWFSSKEMVKCSGIDSPNSSRDCLFMDSYIEMAENTDRHVSFSMCSKWNCICTINSPKRQAEHAGFIFKVGFLWLNIHRHKSPYHHFALSVLTFFLMDPSKTGQIPWHSMLDSKLFLWLDSAILSAFSTLWKS